MTESYIEYTRRKLMAHYTAGELDDETLNAALAILDAKEPPPAPEPEVEPWLVGFEAPERNDSKLLIAELMRTGVDELEARRIAMDMPDHPEVAAEKAEARYQAVVDAAKEEARQNWLRTPEGKRHTAAEALAAQEKRAEDVKLSRALLIERGEHPIADMSDEEILEAAALDTTDELDPADHYGANVAAAIAETPSWGSSPDEGGEGSAAE